MAFVVEEKIGEENARKHSLDKVQKDIRDKIFKCDCLFAVKKQWILATELHCKTLEPALKVGFSDRISA